MPKKQDRCENCACWAREEEPVKRKNGDINEKYQKCRRHPPVPVWAFGAMNQIVFHYPFTEAKQHCFDYISIPKVSTNVYQSLQSYPHT